MSKINRKSLKQRVIEQTLAAIETGELKAGQRVTELGLGNRLGVSQPTIREALIELEKQGFVERRPPRKTFITVLTRRDIAEIYRVRTPLEILVVQLLIEAGANDLKHSERAYREMLDHANAENMPAFLRADLSFHRGLWYATNNRHLKSTLELLVPKLLAFGIIRHVQPPRERLVDVAQMHGQLLRLIREEKQSEASALMEASLQQAWADDSQLAEDPQSEV
ncbi:MAG: GntR family transcriptional regulator [Acidobacteriota bacterium]